MRLVSAASPRAAAAPSLVEALQRYFVDLLGPADFERPAWRRDGGRHGGGARFACAETGRFNRASVNVSSVH